MLCCWVLRSLSPEARKYTVLQERIGLTLSAGPMKEKRWYAKALEITEVVVLSHAILLST